VRRFDFNGSGNFTAAGFAGVRGSQLFNLSLGHGWNAAASEFERSGPSPLRRDGHFLNLARTFQIVVDPAKSYNVRVYVGDPGFARDQIRVTVEGAAPYTIASLAAGVFNVTTTAAPLSASADGVLTVQIADLGGDPYWVANGIDIWETAASDPGVQPQTAQALGSAAASLLTERELAPVIDEAVSRWTSQASLSHDVAAWLRQTPIAIGNLDAQVHLGQAVDNRVALDDNAAGWGWHTDFRQPLPAQRVDLLTVVMHELGHVLGYDDLDEGADSEQLMSGLLGAGRQRAGSSPSLSLERWPLSERAGSLADTTGAFSSAGSRLEQVAQEPLAGGEWQLEDRAPSEIVPGAKDTSRERLKQSARLVARGRMDRVSTDDAQEEAAIDEAFADWQSGDWVSQ
jgi:hypothetical protein